MDVDAVVRAAARKIKSELPQLTPVMTTMFVRVIPELGQDSAVGRMVLAGTSKTLHALVDMLDSNTAIADIAAPAAAADYARRFSQLELPLGALLRAFRLGEHMFQQWALTALSTQELTAEQALAGASRIGLTTSSYLDRVIEELTDHYEDERAVRAERFLDEVKPAEAAIVRLRETLQEFLAIREDEPTESAGRHRTVV